MLIKFNSIDIHLNVFLADYVRFWCKANGFCDPSDSLINEAITEKNQLCQKATQKKAVFSMKEQFVVDFLQVENGETKVTVRIIVIETINLIETINF